MNGGGAYKMIEIKKVAINIILFHLQYFLRFFMYALQRQNTEISKKIFSEK